MTGVKPRFVLGMARAGVRFSLCVTSSKAEAGNVMVCSSCCPTWRTKMLLHEFWGLTHIMLKLFVIGKAQFLGTEMGGC